MKTKNSSDERLVNHEFHFKPAAMLETGKSLRDGRSFY
jgi:hypothetical protein